MNLSHGWSRAGGLHARGGAIVDGELLDASALARRLDRLGMDAATLLSCNGGFAAVQVSDASLVAAVDRVRTIPLFFARDGASLYLSDDAYWVADQLPRDEYDDVCVAEFVLLGYVTGRDTLHRRVKQLRAGERLVVHAEAGDLSVVTERWFSYDHRDPFREPFEQVLDRCEETWLRVMERLARSAEGRTIVIPLSGGWDSRLILLGLKQVGYEHVQCFTYGVPGIAEVRISEHVAGRLGVPWRFVPYSIERWRRWHDAPEFRRFMRYADGLSSVPHVQDWPAVWELRAAGEVPDDAIFAPGHNGGFLCGENGALHRMRRPTLVDVVRDLERVHYSHGRLVDRRLREEVRARLTQAVTPFTDETAEGATSAFEHWEWQERQAKFICNSVRAYEFWGFDWRMPYWDSETIEFWQHVPLALRVRERLHRAHLARASRREQLPVLHADLRRVVGEAVSRNHVPQSAKRVVKRLRRYRYRHEYSAHQMGWYGMIDLERFRHVYRGTETINSVLALERLGLLSPDEA